MTRQNAMRSFGIVVTAMVLIAAASGQAAIVTDNLVLYLDAGNSGNGVGHLGSGNPWINLSGSATNHDATLVGTADWGGTGTTTDPFVVQFRSSAGGVTAEGYAVVGGSTPGSDLDLSPVFTYELWAKIIGDGSGDSAFADTGVLMSHSSYYPQGNGSITYTYAGAWNGYTPDSLYNSGGSADPSPSLPNSNGLIGDGFMHHIVLTRAGDGDTDTSWYLDGVLMGAFKSTSSPTDDTYGPYPFTIGARKKWYDTFDQGANADIAQVRVYSTALTADEVLQNFNAGLTPAAPPTHAGDFNGDGAVDGADFVAWQTHFPTATGATLADGDANGDGAVDGADFVIWQTNFPYSPTPGLVTIPEPPSIVILFTVLLTVMFARGKAACQGHTS
ncbi:MAG: hypothetical protein IT427_01985 [Pirellulales bacterium]|nr:hypothetical protein [Pirellulales bacterium]